MRSPFTIAAFVLAISTAAAQPAEVAAIDNWVDEVSLMVSEWELMERYITYTFPTIPAIGMPQSSVTGWFQQYEVEGMPGEIDELPLCIENYYQHAGQSALETYYYKPDGEMVCCTSTINSYLVRDNTVYSDVFYFNNGEPVYYITGTGETYETLDDEAFWLAEDRLMQAEALYRLFMDPFVPIPCIFWESWGQ